MREHMRFSMQECLQVKPTERIEVYYEESEKEIMDYNIHVVTCQTKVNDKMKISRIYPNQVQCAKLVVTKFRNRKIVQVMVTAGTQTGKTGMMCAFIDEYINSNHIPVGHIYIITGLSSKDWIKQTKMRLPASLRDRVFHRHSLTREFVQLIKNQKNVLVIMDEVHIAARVNQTINKAFESAGFYDLDNLLRKDIKIVEFSATPDGTIFDLMKWGDHACHVRMEPGYNYTGCCELLQQGRVFQFKDLCHNEEKAIENITEIKTKMQTSFDTPMYHIIRTPNGKLCDTVKNTFKKVFGDAVTYQSYDAYINEDINKFLKVKPEKDTFIFIKEKIRCAKTIEKEYLGIVYDRFSSCPDDAVVIQGLIGRGTGYDDNGKSIYYTNVKSIHNYKRLLDSNFQDNSVSWNSKTTTCKLQKLQSKGTFNKPSLVRGISNSSDDDSNSNDYILKYMELDTQEQAYEYARSSVGHRLRTRKKNDTGFYEATIKGKKKVWSRDEIRSSSTFLGAANNKCWMYPCYIDTTDKTSLRFLVIHKQRSKV